MNVLKQLLKKKVNIYFDYGYVFRCVYVRYANFVNKKQPTFSYNLNSFMQNNIWLWYIDFYRNKGNVSNASHFIYT